MRRILAIVMAFAVAITFMPWSGIANAYAEETASATTQTVTMNGSGTPEDPYQICDKYQFDAIRYDMTASYVLMNDIVFTEEDFQPGGDFFNDGKGWRTLWEVQINGVISHHNFTGILDGNGKSIKGIRINDGGSIFRCIKNATIKNLNLENAILTCGSGRTGTGLLAAEMKGGSIEQCTIDQTSALFSDAVKDDGSLGGFVGYSSSGAIVDCINYADITAGKYTNAGGFVGFALDDSIIRNCKNHGAISGRWTGGIAAITGYSSAIEQCENYGHISGQTARNDIRVGGISGSIGEYSTIKESFNLGSVTGTTYSERYSANVGGITGSNYSSIKNCYNSGEVRATGNSEDVVANAGGISAVCEAVISNCFNSGEVTSLYRAGGVASYIDGSNSKISKCYNVGIVSANNLVAGITTDATGGATVSNAYYLTEETNDNVSAYGKRSNEALYSAGPSEVNEQDDVQIVSYGERTNIQLMAPKPYGSGLTKEKMQKKSSFKNFDFSKTWTISNTKSYKYPTLKKMAYQESVKVNSIAIMPIVGTADGACQFDVVFAPTNTTSKSVKWSSSNEAVATVDVAGKVTAISPGTVTITCKTKAGNKTATNKITVLNDLSISPSVFEVKAPSTVSASLRTVSGGYDDIHVTWQESAGADGYVVYLKKGKGKYNKPAYTFKTSYIANNLADGVLYTVKIVPYSKSKDGTKKLSNQFKATTVRTLKRITLSKVREKGTKVEVIWKNINGETGYQISQSAKKAGTNIVSTYKTTKGNYKSITAKKGKTYYYKVRAYKVIDGKKVFGPWSSVKKFKRI
ncbi:MAG: Ig domain-containing protein [Firmicutes bacterium]|nr:Ig domain-containing protein [Bacillota bacterium]